MNIKKQIIDFTLNLLPCRLRDKIVIKRVYRKRMGVKLDLDHPTKYTEKLQWLKLYYRNTRLTGLVDKYSVKKIVGEKIGEQYIIPTLGVWENAEEIDFSSLPESFILKCTHDSGSYYICHDKSCINQKLKDEIIAFFKTRLQRNWYLMAKEWPYKNVTPRIIAEPLLKDEESECLVDYKFFCFNGVPKVMYISRDISHDARTDFFDMDFNHLDLTIRDANADVTPEKPQEFEEMKRLSEILSQDFPHVRVDFYVVNHQIYFGELTFFHNGGWSKFNPPIWDKIWGDWINLNNIDID